jgi:hypothetical protein
VTAQTITGAAGTVTWQANPPAGITVTPSSGTIDVPATGPASAQIAVTAAADATQGFDTVPVTFTAADGTALPAGTLSLTVAQPGSMLWNYNNIGVSDDSAPTAASLDSGGWSFSAQALAAAGVTPGAAISSGGFTFAWPTNPVALPDNIRASGQTLDLSSAAPSATQLSFLGTSTNGNASGTATITYTDGTTQTATIGFGDWTLGGGSEGVQFGNTMVTQMPYRNSVSGEDDVTSYLFATAPIALQAGKQVASVTLPATVSNGALHVFAVATA